MSQDLHILSIVGARPQFIKLAPFSAEARRRGHQETVVHTGQHYDEGMSARFFTELDMPPPTVNLGIGSGSHGQMTARALEGIEAEILARKPDAVVVFGDTNSTLAGALAAAKLGVYCAHIEAGLRSYVRAMPEEVNRIVADHTCDLLLAPNLAAMVNLANEGLEAKSRMVGDIMVDSLQYAIVLAEEADTVLTRLGVEPGPFVLATVHRAANTDDPAKLAGIFAGMADAGLVVLPLHPRTKAAIEAQSLSLPPNIRLVEPLGYFDILALQRGARAIATDSGGIQKEAYLLETPCITLREETEWTETVELGWNVLVGADSEAIAQALARPPRGPAHPPVYGDGRAAGAILNAIEEGIGSLDKGL